MATFVLEDLAAAMEVMVFPKTMQQYGELLEPDAIVVLKSRIDKREDTPKLIAMEITRPEINLDGALPLTLRVKATVLTDQRVARLRELLRAHPGDCPVFVRVIGSEKETVLRLGEEFRCDARNGLYAELRVLFGADCIA
jgi:DNA polymerase-3 subunit alpha